MGLEVGVDADVGVGVEIGVEVGLGTEVGEGLGLGLREAGFLMRLSGSAPEALATFLASRMLMPSMNIS